MVLPQPVPTSALVHCCPSSERNSAAVKVATEMSCIHKKLRNQRRERQQYQPCFQRKQWSSVCCMQVLMASAKSFEEFVGEQLRQDGSGQVLRREGATGLLVPRGKALTQAFVVGAGCYLCWEFRVKVWHTILYTRKYLMKNMFVLSFFVSGSSRGFSVKTLLTHTRTFGQRTSVSFYLSARWHTRAQLF